MNASDISSVKTATAAEIPDNGYRVIIVDDSSVIRSLIARALKGEKDFNVVATAANGQAAVEVLRRHPAEVIILDIEMPVMDGLTAIPLLKAIDPNVQIIMASTLTQKNAEISLKAMSLGATDYIPKPSADNEQAKLAADFNRELIEKVRILGARARRRAMRSVAGTQAGLVKAEPSATEKKKISLRLVPLSRPDIIAIGSSTGGPQALFEVIKKMGDDLPQPIVLTQHMPPVFTTILAEHISRQCKVICTEAKDGEVLQRSHYYIAPGDFHMLVVKTPKGPTIKITKDPQENYCRPAVDPMLRSLVEIYGKKILAVILTGMGQDGLRGSEKVVEAGGGVIAQDENTSVVWGMPGAVAIAGICSKVLPIEEIGTAVRALAMKVAP